MPRLQESFLQIPISKYSCSILFVLFEYFLKTLTLIIIVILFERPFFWQIVLWPSTDLLTSYEKQNYCWIFFFMQKYHMHAMWVMGVNKFMHQFWISILWETSLNQPFVRSNQKLVQMGCDFCALLRINLYFLVKYMYVQSVDVWISVQNPI